MYAFFINEWAHLAVILAVVGWRESASKTLVTVSWMSSLVVEWKRRERRALAVVRVDAMVLVIGVEVLP